LEVLGQEIGLAIQAERTRCGPRRSAALGGARQAHPRLDVSQRCVLDV